MQEPNTKETCYFLYKNAGTEQAPRTFLTRSSRPLIRFKRPTAENGALTISLPASCAPPSSSEVADVRLLDVCPIGSLADSKTTVLENHTFKRKGKNQMAPPGELLAPPGPPRSLPSDHG